LPRRSSGRAETKRQLAQQVFSHVGPPPPIPRAFSPEQNIGVPIRITASSSVNGPRPFLPPRHLNRPPSARSQTASLGCPAVRPAIPLADRLDGSPGSGLRSAASSPRRSSLIADSHESSHDPGNPHSSASSNRDPEGSPLVERPYTMDSRPRRAPPASRRPDGRPAGDWRFGPADPDGPPQPVPEPHAIAPPVDCLREYPVSDFLFLGSSQFPPTAEAVSRPPRPRPLGVKTVLDGPPFRQRRGIPFRPKTVEHDGLSARSSFREFRIRQIVSSPRRWPRKRRLNCRLRIHEEAS